MLKRISVEECQKGAFGHPLAHQADWEYVGDPNEWYDVWMAKILPCNNLAAIRLWEQADLLMQDVTGMMHKPSLSHPADRHGLEAL
jgi:hypothetical protein